MRAKQLAMHLQHGLQQLPLHSSLFRVSSHVSCSSLIPLAPNLRTDSTQHKKLTDLVRMPVPSKGKRITVKHRHEDGKTGDKQSGSERIPSTCWTLSSSFTPRSLCSTGKRGPRVLSKATHRTRRSPGHTGPSWYLSLLGQ